MGRVIEWKEVHLGGSIFRRSFALEKVMHQEILYNRRSYTWKDLYFGRVTPGRSFAQEKLNIRRSYAMKRFTSRKIPRHPSSPPPFAKAKLQEELHLGRVIHSEELHTMISNTLKMSRTLKIYTLKRATHWEKLRT